MNPNDNPCYNCPDGPSDTSECEFCPHGQDEPNVVPPITECYPDPWADDYALIIAEG
jgi:hypothetical protein